MKLPRNLAGWILADGLCREFGYQRLHQTGRHIILQTEEPIPQRLSIPNHDALRIGTLAAILTRVAIHKGVSRDELLQRIGK